MFERLKTLYESGKITETHLDKAILKGWITNEEKILILGI